MIRSYILNNYLSKEFLKTTFNITILFFCLGFTVNIFEEINFFKDYGVGVYIPVFLTTLVLPSLMYNMFPFIIFLSGMWFFLKIKKTDEIIAIKVSGLSNFSVILIPSILSLILGILIVTAINPITAAMVKKYESIKGTYEIDQAYLAAITVNGIWIKEKYETRNSIIRSSKLKGDKLINVTIYEFDNNNDFIKRIEAKSADINSTNWILNEVKVLDSQGNYIYDDIEKISYTSMYDIEKIKTLYSNLDTISFWNLENQIQLFEERGYSTRDMQTKLQKSFAFPFFLLCMILLSGVLTLGIRSKENNWIHVFLAIISSVLIYFFNDFSAALGKTEKLPIELSVWIPIIVIFIFSTVGLIHANQK